MQKQKQSKKDNETVISDKKISAYMNEYALALGEDPLITKDPYIAAYTDTRELEMVTREYSIINGGANDTHRNGTTNKESKEKEYKVYLIEERDHRIRDLLSTKPIIFDVSDRPLLCMTNCFLENNNNNTTKESQVNIDNCSTVNKKLYTLIGSCDHRIYSAEIQFPLNLKDKLYSSKLFKEKKERGGVLRKQFHGDWVSTVSSILHEGNIISASGSIDGSVVLFYSHFPKGDLRHGKCNGNISKSPKENVWNFKHHLGSVSRVRLVNKGIINSRSINPYLITASYDRKILIYELNSIFNENNYNKINNKKTKISSPSQKSPPSSVEPIASFSGSQSAIIDFVIRGYHSECPIPAILSLSRGGAVILWDIETTKAISVWNNIHEGTALCIDGSSSSNYALSGDSKGILCSHDLRSPSGFSNKHKLFVEGDGVTNIISTKTNDREVLVGSATSSFKILDSRYVTRNGRIDASMEFSLNANMGFVYCGMFISNEIALSTSNGFIVCLDRSSKLDSKLNDIFDISSENTFTGMKMSLSESTECKNAFRFIEYHNDDMIIGGGDDGKIVVWSSSMK